MGKQGSQIKMIIDAFSVGLTGYYRFVKTSPDHAVGCLGGGFLTVMVFYGSWRSGFSLGAPWASAGHHPRQASSKRAAKAVRREE